MKENQKLVDSMLKNHMSCGILKISEYKLSKALHDSISLGDAKSVSSLLFLNNNICQIPKNLV